MMMPATFLEHELRRQLHHPRPTATKPGIRLGLVRRLRNQPLLRRTGADEEIRQRKVGMVKNVEELSTKLELHIFKQGCILCDREIHIRESRTIDFVSTQ